MDEIRIIVKDKKGNEIGDVSFDKRYKYWETLHYKSDRGYYGADTKEIAIKEVHEMHDDYLSEIKKEYNRWRRLYNKWIINPKKGKVT